MPRAKTYRTAGDGWEAWTHSLLGELNIELTPKTTGLLSGRLDKHSYTHSMFSPRGALIHELRPDHYLKFIAQRSVRMNTHEELFMNHELGQENDPEKLDSLEAIYAGRLTKQIDWELDKNVLVSGISYSDYYQNAGSGVIITSKGNDLNNWPDQATKLFSNVRFLKGKLVLHGDVRAFWGFKGSEDGLDALADAGGTPAAVQNARHHDAYAAQISAGLSLAYNIDSKTSLTVFAQNIPVVGDNKRYAYSSGFKNRYPDKVSWVEEPTIVGVSYLKRF